MKKHLLLAIIVLGLAVTMADSIPHLINYQGYLTDPAGTPLDTSVNVTISLYDGPNVGANTLFSDAFDVTTHDGFGDDNYTQCRCAPFWPYSATIGGDCDDFNAQVDPGHAEVCSNGTDDDCDGAIDLNDTDCQ